LRELDGGELDGGVLASLGFGRAAAWVVVGADAAPGRGEVIEERTVPLTTVCAGRPDAVPLDAVPLDPVPPGAVHAAVTTARAATANHALDRNGHRAGRFIRLR
jgi:hypothetical protein